MKITESITQTKADSHPTRPNWDFVYESELNQHTLWGANLNKLMRLYWHCNEPIQSQFPLSSIVGRSAYLLWFLQHAMKQLGFSKLPVDFTNIVNGEHHNFEFVQGGISIEAKFIAYWLIHPELRSEFDVFSEHGLFRYVVWLMQERLINYHFFLTKVSQKKSQISETLIQLDAFMLMVWESRRDLQDIFKLDSEESKAAYLLWFLSYGASEYSFWVDSDESWRQQIEKVWPFNPTLPMISKIMYLVWASNAGLRNKFNLKSLTGRVCYYIWYHYISQAKHERRIEAAFFNAKKLNSTAISTPKDVDFALLLGDFNWLNTQHSCIEVKNVQKKSSKSKGINLVGPASGSFGLAQHVRYVQRCLQAATVNFSSADFHTMHSNNRESVLREKNDCLNDKKEYESSLFCANPDWLFSIIGSEQKHLLTDSFSIQYGYWELSKYPTSWLELLQPFDEIWAPSKFIFDALKDNHQSVQHMPVAVHVDNSALVFGREHFGLPRKTFLFYFSFDGFSYMARKNPLACIQAFKYAFPLGNESAGLVIKCRNMVSSSITQALEDYLYFLEWAKKDKRIFVIESDLTRTETDALMDSIDCYVSLHRSEGFGYGMAEAMYLGKPVIATAYSGNLDFTHPDNSCLVDFELVPVLPNQYIHSNEQVWAEASIEHAAWYMRRIYEDSAVTRQIGLAGQNYIYENHSIGKISSVIQMRLQELNLV